MSLIICFSFVCGSWVSISTKSFEKTCFLLCELLMPDISIVYKMNETEICTGIRIFCSYKVSVQIRKGNQSSVAYKVINFLTAMSLCRLFRFLFFLPFNACGLGKTTEHRIGAERKNSQKPLRALLFLLH